MYSFLNEAFEYPYTYDPATARLRTHEITSAAVQPIKSGFKGAAWGGAGGALAGGLAASRMAKSRTGKIIAGSIGALAGTMAGSGIGASIGTGIGAVKGGVRATQAITGTKKQLIDRDNARQQGVLNSRWSSSHQKLQAQARMIRNNRIDTNLRNYKDAIANTPDAADREEIRRAYRATGRHINDIHGANMQYT